MFYDRKIRYLEDRIDGERVRTTGFVKAEVRGELCRIEIHVAGIHRTDTFEKTVFVLDGKKEEVLCKIKIVEGKGETGELCFPVGQLGEAGIPYGDLEEIRIPLAAGRELRCLWKEKMPDRAVQRKIDTQQKGEVTAGEEMVQTPDAIDTNISSEETINSTQTELSTEKNTRSAMQSAEADKISNASKTDTSVSAENAVQGTVADKMPDAPKTDVVTPQPLENKWEQLFAIYPHITPFGDEREYLSLGPEDFVIFPARYYQLVNNSFLLHGYHNYSHLILTRIVHRGEIRYYIGVPGNYYEKEKQVAIMFGFESFECKTEPVQQGDYGYYMMRIEL